MTYVRWYYTQLSLGTASGYLVFATVKMRAFVGDGRLSALYGLVADFLCAVVTRQVSVGAYWYYYDMYSTMYV